MSNEWLCCRHYCLEEFICRQPRHTFREYWHEPDHKLLFINQSIAHFTCARALVWQSDRTAGLIFLLTSIYYYKSSRCFAEFSLLLFDNDIIINIYNIYLHSYLHYIIANGLGVKLAVNCRIKSSIILTILLKSVNLYSILLIL